MCESLGLYAACLIPSRTMNGTNPRPVGRSPERTNAERVGLRTGSRAVLCAHTVSCGVISTNLFHAVQTNHTTPAFLYLATHSHSQYLSLYYKRYTLPHITEVLWLNIVRAKTVWNGTTFFFFLNDDTL